MNVLIIMTDQQRADTLDGPNTPGMNKLASQGVRFNCFAQSPQCQPSRAAFWTGRYPSSLKLWWNEMSLPQNEQTLANMLCSIQYDTGYFGKWHLDKDSTTLGHFGFDPLNSYLMEDWCEGKDLPTRDAGVARREYLEIMKQKAWASKLSNRLYQHEDVIAEKAVKFMSKSKKLGRKFMCTIGFRGPHPPYTAPPPYCDLYDPASFSVPRDSKMYDGKKLTEDDWRIIKSQYYGNIAWIDDNIVRIMEYVDRKAPDTVVIFTSDHGEMLGDHGYFAKGLYAYDPTVAVPLVIRAPGFEARYYREITQHIDVVPTVLEMLGQERSPGIQGKSLVGAMKTGEVVNQFALSMMGYEPRLKMIRNHRFKYWNYNGHEYLFNLIKDPDESSNKASTLPGPLSAMRLHMTNCLIGAEDRLPIPQ